MRVGPGYLHAGGEIPGPGDVTLPVDALDVPPGSIGAFTIEVGYDPLLVVATACTTDPGSILDSAICSPAFAPDVARCTGISIAGVSGPELTLCDITFEFVDAGTPITTVTPLVVSCLVLTDPGGDPLGCSQQDGWIDFGLGDVTCDDLVNVVDALFVMQFEVGLRDDSGGCPLPPSPDTLHVASCDVNEDGLCNVVDALFILQCEVGIPNVLCPAPILLGDVNCDGLVDMIDLLLILQYDAGLIDGSFQCPPPPGTIYLPACDVNGDGLCNAEDAEYLPCVIDPFCFPPLGG